MTDTRSTPAAPPDPGPDDAHLSDARLLDALARHWTRDPAKVAVLSRDTWFLDAAEQLLATTPDAAAVGADVATLLVKPDGIATGSARTVVDWLGESGFAIRHATAVSMDANGIRALWYHQWNIASAERRLLADLLCGLSPALLLIVGRAAGADAEGDADARPVRPVRPCAVDLTELKGATAPDRRRPEHLRGRLPGGSYLLNQVHTADEPADALRELGVYLTYRDRQRCLDRIVSRHDASTEAASLADALDAEFGGRTTAEEPAWEALAPLRRDGESDADMCLRLLRTPEPVPPELEWPLLVAGAGCLPLRTPTGSVMLPTPPASAWDAPPTPARRRGTVDRTLVHRRAVAETFATGIGPTLLDSEGRRVVDAAIQLARAHPVYTDHLGAQRGRADLLHLMEAVRQVCIGAGQREFGAGPHDVFVVRRFCAEFHGTPPALDDVPLDLHPRLTATAEHRPAPDAPVSGLDVEIGIEDEDGRPVGRCWGAYSWVPGPAFKRFREGMRNALGLAGPSVPAPCVDPIPAHEVSRAAPDNSVLGRDGSDALVLAVDTSHPVHFDHPLDHVPGMLQIEGARQAALLTLEPSARERAVVTRVESTFPAFAELDLPVTCRGEPRPTGDGRVRIEFEQAGRVVSAITVTLEVGAAG